MPDVSMKAWLGRLFCDDPRHIREDPNHPDFIDDFDTRAEIREHATLAGWKFKRDGRVICPACIKLPAR